MAINFKLFGKAQQHDIKFDFETAVGMNIDKGIKLHFQRFEFKYLVDTATKDEIKKYIQPYVIPDPYVENTKNKSYEVVSLYFDSPLFYYYHEKMDGVENRKKIRLRTYRNDGKLSDNCFFEIKRKHDAVVLKDRFRFSTQQYINLAKCDNPFPVVLLDGDKTGEKIINEFEVEKYKHSISPRLLVIYEREPFLGKYNKNFRVTFDSNIKAVESDNLLYEGSDFKDISWNQDLRGLTVMEIKFTGVLPSYIKDVVQKFDLERTAFSKYCFGIEACNSLGGLVTPPAFLGADNFDINSVFNNTKIWKI